MKPWTRLLLCGIALAALGCSRAHYRQQADREAYELIARASGDGCPTPGDASIDPDPRSRMYDPDNPDRPPMPPDDPTSHELMLCVDCKRGSPCWHQNGQTSDTENPDWMTFLTYDDQGQIVLDREASVALSLLHSREFQQEREDLYLSALDVTFQRFRFDTQFFGGNSTFFTSDGPSRSGTNTLNTDTNFQLSKAFATGGQLVAGAANSIVWQFAGPDGYGANTLLDFSLVQPLLRGAGRAVVLEQLTDSERALLANIRQMERFRRGFYAQVVSGRSAGAGPSRGGIGIIIASASGAGGAGGFLGLLEQQVRIDNQRNNVTNLANSLERLEAILEGGDIGRNQVDRARQSLLSGQSQFLSITANYQTRLDAFKTTLGLPPGMDVRIEDSLLKRFDLIDPALVDTRNDLAELAQTLRDLTEPAEIDPNTPYVDHVAKIEQAGRAWLRLVEQDIQRMIDALPRRSENLRLLAMRPEVQRDEAVSSLYDERTLKQRMSQTRNEFAELANRLGTTLDDIVPFAQATEATIDEISRVALLELVDKLSSELLELSLMQARARLDAITLEPIELTDEEALEIARPNRRDWMNARAALVDRWRQIEVRANDLQSNLDITFSGDINTTDNNPVRFRDTTGRLRAGLEFDAPLTRLAERNAYREALISYQQARRQFYRFEDSIQQSLRGTIRTIQLNQMDFEVSRAALAVAISRVDESNMKLYGRAKPGQPLSATLVQDLVDALQALLVAQNEFLGIWVNQEALRINLDFDLGTMELDGRGMWIDPGPVQEAIPGDELQPDADTQRDGPPEIIAPGILTQSARQLIRS